MIIKVFAAILIVSGCGGIGFSMCKNYLKEERSLESFCRCLDWMILELNYRMPPLHQLCEEASNIGFGEVKRVLKCFAEELQRQIIPGVSLCMETALASVEKLPEKLEKHLKDFGASVGTLDINGQLDALHALSERCKQDVNAMEQQKQNRLQNYKTFGICAGIALVILLF